MKEKKSKQTRKSLTAIDMHKYYKKKYGDGTPYLLYKEVISRFNKKMVDAILTGYNFNPKNNIGRIRIKKVVRKFKKPRVNWAESNKQRKAGIVEYLVFYTAPYWYRWYWEKKKCNIKNKTVYCFIPTVSNSRKDGSRNKLSKLLQSNPLAALKFEL